jgi:hypothetical protein
MFTLKRLPPGGRPPGLPPRRGAAPEARPPSRSESRERSPLQLRTLATAIALASGDGGDPTFGVLLLEDVRSVFAKREAEVIATADLIRALADVDESPCGEWWLDKDGELARGAPRKLARLLRPFGIRPQSDTAVRRDPEDRHRSHRRGPRRAPPQSDIRARSTRRIVTGTEA